MNGQEKERQVSESIIERRKFGKTVLIKFQLKQIHNTLKSANNLVHKNIKSNFV
jgi:hypothetical protein